MVYMFHCGFCVTVVVFSERAESMMGVLCVLVCVGVVFVFCICV